MLDHLLNLEEAPKRFREPIVLKDLNMDLKEARRPQIRQVADLLAEYGLIELVRHFLQHRRFHNLNTCSQDQQGTVLRSICDYIIGTDRHHFELIGIRDMRNILSDHFALRDRLLRCPTRCHARYLGGGGGGLS